MKKWTHVIRMDFQIHLLDGTSIHGGGGDLEIGATVDSNLAVLRNPANDEPYIPGSSLKGKMRSVLEKEYGKYVDQGRDRGKPCGCGRLDCPVCVVFGAHPVQRSPEAPPSAPTRIVVRDSAMTDQSKQDWKARIREGKPALEQKTENIINRVSGTAEHPRTGERVLPGTKFAAQIILHVFDGDSQEKFEKLIKHALGVIQDASSLGAGGTRGSGRVRFENLSVTKTPLDQITL